MSDQAKYVVTCPQCGSPDVTVDAVARWNIDTGEWELSTTFDNRTCGSCSYEGYSFCDTLISEMTLSQKEYVESKVENYEIPECLRRLV